MVVLVVARPTPDDLGGPDLIGSSFGQGGQPKQHPKMKIVAEGKKAFTVPYAPRETTHDGFAPAFTLIDRGGREPLLVRSGGQLKTVSFELVLGYFNPNHSIEAELKALTALAESGARMRIKLDDILAAKRWRLTGFNYTVAMRQHGTNAPTRAIANMLFTEASDPVVEVGPVSGGHHGGGDSGSGGGKWPKFYTTKKGDTLQAVAIRFYGDPSLWRDIADANKIRKPKNVKVGTKLRIPKPAPGAYAVPVLP